MNRQALHSFILPRPSADTRRERRKQEIQSFILEAAIDLFGENGYDATTVEQICERADVSRQTFYSYYPTKAQLLSALSEVSAVQTPQHLIAEARARSDDALEQICLFVDSVASNMRNSTALERTLRREMMKYVEKFDEGAETRWSYTGLALADLIRSGQAAGQISAQHDAVFLGEMIAGTMNFIAIRWSFDQSYPQEEHLQALQKFLRATLAPPGNANSKEGAAATKKNARASGAASKKTSAQQPAAAKAAANRTAAGKSAKKSSPTNKR